MEQTGVEPVYCLISASPLFALVVAKARKHAVLTHILYCMNYLIICKLI